MGLPCPNLGTGGYAFHGEYEHITIEGMEIATNIIIEAFGNLKNMLGLQTQTTFST